MSNLRKLLRKLIVLIVCVTVVSILAVPQVSAFIDKKIDMVFHYLYSLTQNVTITAIPAWGSMPVTDFMVLEINDELVCTWTNSPTGVATMVRAKYGSELDSITDGYEVYYGPLETCTDLGVSIDDNLAGIYYSAWSINGASLWSDPVSDVYEVGKMALIIVTAAFIGLAFWRRSNFLTILGGLVAIAFGAYWIAQYDGFIYVIQGVVAIAIGLYMLIDTAVGMVRG